MTDLLVSSRVWPTLAAESARYWMRRHRALVPAIAVTTLAGMLSAITGKVDHAQTLIAMIAFFAPFLGGLVSMSGIVVDERESGLILLWFQKPGSLVRSYTIRYALYQALMALFAIALGGIVGGVGAATGLFALTKAARIVGVMLPIALIPAAMVFAFSAWGVRRDSVMAFFVILASVTLGAAFSFDEGVVATTVKAVIFPLDSIQAISGSPAFSAGLARPVALVVSHFAAWTLIGLAGLRYTERALRRGL